MSTNSPPAGSGKNQPALPSLIPWISIVAVVGIASATMLYVVGQKKQGESGPAASSATIVPESPPSVVATTNGGKVELLVLASPPEAVITLDGTQLASNPFRAEVERGKEMHKIRVTAEGYETQEKALVFDLDSNTVKITLVRIENEPPVVPGVARPATPVAIPTKKNASPTVGDTPTVGDRLKTNRDPGSPSRTIDDKDPYAP